MPDPVTRRSFFSRLAALPALLPLARLGGLSQSLPRAIRGYSRVKLSGAMAAPAWQTSWIAPPMPDWSLGDASKWRRYTIPASPVVESGPVADPFASMIIDTASILA